MSGATFSRQAQAALAMIPETFLRQVENLSLQIEEWADSEVLADLGMDDPCELLGFYNGWPLDERGSEYGNCLPDIITLYQGAIEAYAVEHGLPLTRVIAETIIHELAHYFGFSEEEMDEIEAFWSTQRELFLAADEPT
ncbi:MAG: neutral zinc metallopeptidase [Desulfuromonas sp.]|nr:MAG: neutral zinc metallopeptidase [Desulfuromonas sp.]